MRGDVLRGMCVAQEIGWGMEFGVAFVLIQHLRATSALYSPRMHLKSGSPSEVKMGSSAVPLGTQ